MRRRDVRREGDVGPSGSPYDDRFWERLEKTLREAVIDHETARPEAEAWLSRFERAEPGKKLKMVSEKGFQPLAVAGRLLELARRPGPGQEASARVALTLVPRLDSAGPARDLWPDFHAAARGALGEALLGRGDLAGAECELLEALRLLSRVGDDEERALLSRRLAHLRWEQGRIEETVAHLLRARELAQAPADPDFQTEVLLDLGFLYLEELDDLPRALEAYDGLLLLPRKTTRWQAGFVALHGWVRAALPLLGAETTLARMDREARRQAWPGGSRESLALHSLRGRVLLALGRRRPAQPKLSGAFRKLLALEAFEDAALAGVAYLRAHLPCGSRGFSLTLAEIALAAGQRPAVLEPLERVVRIARAGQINAEWLQAQEDRLESEQARRRHPYRGATS